jgi:hypothetical protein
LNKIFKKKKQQKKKQQKPMRFLDYGLLAITMQQFWR